MMKVQFLLKNTGMHERLGIMTLSSILKQQGHSVRLLLTEDLAASACIDRIKDFAPHVLAYSIMTGEHTYHIALNQMIRKHYDCFSVFGGPHPTFAPDMISKKDVDAVCRGEGDISFVRLLERMDQGRNFYDIANFWFKTKNGQIIRNDIAPLVQDLDNLPFPDRQLLYDADPALRVKSDKLFMAMRGCPYECAYCFNHAYNKLIRGRGAVVRVRSVANVLAEIQAVKDRYPLEFVYIDDDTFLVKPSGWIEEFAEQFPRLIGLPLICNVRANLLSQDRMGKLLRQMGCRKVWMGVECGNNDVATKLLRRNITNDQIAQACAILHHHQIRIVTQNLIGLPVEDPLAVDLQTLDFNIRLKPDFGWSSIFYPYPDTAMGMISVQNGMFAGTFENGQVSNKTGSVLEFRDVRVKRRLINLHKLFGLIVQFPFLRRFALFLISLPLTTLYTWLFFAFYGYKTVIKRSGIIGLSKKLRVYIPFYIRYVSRLEQRRLFRQQ